MPSGEVPEVVKVFLDLPAISVFDFFRALLART